MQRLVDLQIGPVINQKMQWIGTDSARFGQFWVFLIVQCVDYSGAYVAYLCLRDVWIRTQRTEVAGRRHASHYLSSFYFIAKKAMLIEQFIAMELPYGTHIIIPILNTEICLYVCR
jgi:hypothetical protein